MDMLHGDSFYERRLGIRQVATDHSDFIVKNVGSMPQALFTN